MCQNKVRVIFAPASMYNAHGTPFSNVKWGWQCNNIFALIESTLVAWYCYNLKNKKKTTKYIRYTPKFLTPRQIRLEFLGHVVISCLVQNLRSLLMQRYRQTSNTRRTLVSNKLLITQMELQHRLSVLLPLHLHSRLKTWLQWIEQRQLQDETRNI